MIILLINLIISSCNCQVNSSDQVKIAMFTYCRRSHLRCITSIAQELSLKPNTKVTVVINGECEELLRNQHYNFEVEVVHSSIDKWNESSPFATAELYNVAYENDVLEVYIPKWKDPKRLPDIIVSDVFSLAGRDLAEIYNLSSVIVSAHLINYVGFSSENFYPEYLPFFTFTDMYEATDNILLRALRYLPKRMLEVLIRYMWLKDSDHVCLKFGISPNSLRKIHSYVIIESFFDFEFPLLLPPYIELVGILQNTRLNNPLDPETKSWLDKSKGFIFISTGSLVQITAEMQETLRNIFTLMNYDFLISSKTLKYDLKNVKIVEWANQLEVLQHENALAFITHGGYSSVIEAIQNIIPILCVPFGLDQYLNCDIVENKIIGKYIRQEYFTTENVLNALNELILNSVFKRDLKKINNIMKSYKGEKRAAEIILDVVKTGGVDHLIPRYNNLPWYQRNDLDIFIVYFLFVYFIYLFLKKLCMRKNKQKTE